MARDPTLDHEYLTILGLPAFSAASSRLLLGSEVADQLTQDGRLVSVQCLSGTGSLRVGADFLSKILGFKAIRYSDPSWRMYHHVTCPPLTPSTVQRITGWCSSTPALPISPPIGTGILLLVPLTLKG